MTAAHDGPWCLTPGQPFIDGVDFWEERFEYKVFNGTHMLQMCACKLTTEAMAAFHRGQVHLGLYLQDGVIFVLFKIDGLYGWSDQAFSMRLVNEAERDVGPHAAGEYQLLNLVLVEAETGLVAGLRVVTWSSHASSVLHRALLAQMAGPFDQDRHREIVANVYAQYPRSKELASAANLRERAGITL